MQTKPSIKCVQPYSVIKHDANSGHNLIYNHNKKYINMLFNNRYGLTRQNNTNKKEQKVQQAR